MDEATISSLTPEQAAREILRIERWSDSLRGRTAGLTWMVWSLVSAGIFVSYELIFFAISNPSWFELATAVAWLPWVAAGAVATRGLWSSVELVMRPKAVRAGFVTAITAAVFLALIFGGLLAIVLWHVPFPEPAWPILAIGVACALVGGLGLTGSSTKERTWWVGGGATLVVGCLVVIALARLGGFDPTLLLAVLGPIATTALMLGGGLYTASLY